MSKQKEIQSKIKALEQEIDNIRHAAFCNKIVDGVAVNGGVDAIDLQAKIVQLEALNENLKSEKLRWKIGMA